MAATTAGCPENRHATLKAGVPQSQTNLTSGNRTEAPKHTPPEPRSTAQHRTQRARLLGTEPRRLAIGQEHEQRTTTQPQQPAESDDDDTDEESEEDDLEQVLETQQKRKRASASHFDASSPDSGKEQSKKKAKTAASATAEFKPPSRSGTLPSRGTVASPSGTSTTARSLGSRLAKVAGPKKK